MAGESFDVPHADTAARAGNHRRRHRRGQGRQQQRVLGAAPDNPSLTAAINTLPGSNMLCREANEAHIALLSTLPPHLAQNCALMGGQLLLANPENEAQQIQNEKMIREFKTMPCGLEGAMSSHDHRCCPFFHSERDRRRLVLGEGQSRCYNAEPCNEQFDDQRLCSHGDSCGLCHSTAELLYHPDFFRKRLCHQAKRCPRGRFCAFAHTRQELLVPHFTELEELEPSEDFIAWRFKTQWCPIGGPHDWENCVYAHTYRDWRRVPTLGYSSRPCPHWVQSVTKGPAELMYADRCPRGMSCPLAHGAKEQLYHPQFYKTSPCSEGSCKRGTLCAFTHGAYDIRKPRADEQLPSAVREPILQALELLGRSQPTFWSPPRYHAFEEPNPRSSSGSGHAIKNGRSRGGSGSSLAMAQQQHGWGAISDCGASNGGMDGALLGTEALLPAALPSVHGAHGHGPVGHHGAGFSPYDMPPQYPMCQWMPMGSEPSTQLIPPAMGYNGQMQNMDAQWMMQSGFATPWGFTPYMQIPGQQNGMQPGPQQAAMPYLGTMPSSPHHVDQASHVLDELASEQDSMSKNGLDGSPMSLSSKDLVGFGMGSEHGDMGMLSLPMDLGGMPSWPAGPATDDEEYSAHQRNHYLRKGLRTPSSLGSPLALSAAATSVPSPRERVEADSNGGSDYHDGSSDSREPHAVEVRGENGVVHIVTQMPGMSRLTDVATHAMKMPTVETEPLALQNFDFEAPPCPSSPARVLLT